MDLQSVSCIIKQCPWTYRNNSVCKLYKKLSDIHRKSIGNVFYGNCFNLDLIATNYSVLLIVILLKTINWGCACSSKCLRPCCMFVEVWGSIPFPGYMSHPSNANKLRFLTNRHAGFFENRNHRMVSLQLLNEIQNHRRAHELKVWISTLCHAS